MKKWLIGLTCVGMLATAAMGQSVVINEFRNDASDAIELVVVTDGLNMQGMILKDYSSSGVNDGGGAFTFSSDALWASVPAGTIILLQKTNTATDVTVGGADYNLAVGLQNTTYFTVGSNSFDISTEEIIQIKASGSGQAGSAGAIHTLATAGAGAQYTSAPTPKLKAATGNTGFQMSVGANNATAALSDFDGTDATGGNATGSIGTYNNANNQTFIEGLRGPATFGVTFNQTSGFTVEQGTGDAITATAANGTEPYGYSWISTLDGAYYTATSNVFNILATAPLGDYSAEVVAMDSDTPAKSVTNSLNFSVVAPVVKYGIAIVTNAPENGTVTTTPATEAAAGASVTVTATPAGGYRVASIVAEDAAMNPVQVIGNAFTMPAAAVTVTVTFEVYAAPDVLIDFETVTGLSGYATATSLVSGVSMIHSGALRGTSASDPKNGAASGRIRYLATNAGFIATANAFAQPITKINFRYADYGSDNTTTFKVQVSQDGASWTDVGAAAYDPDGATLLEATIDTIPANMTYFQILTLGGEADRVCVDDIGIYFGAATFGVTFDQPSGFTIEQGTSDVITATAANGVAPYSYSWSSTLGGAYYSDSADAFTVLATAPLGDYSAEVVAMDSDTPAKSVTNSLNFSVVAPVVKYAITITPPVNGTVTTTPATEAAAGATVSITATPAGGYAVDTYSVVGADSTPIGTSSSFTMPAQPVTVTVTFAVHAGSSLIISEVADPSNNATSGRFVELYNAGASSIDLAAENWFLARQSNGGATWGDIALTGTVAPGGTYVVAGSTNFPTVYSSAPAPNQTSGNIDGNGDDGYFLFSGGRHTNGVLEDAYGVVDQDGSGMTWEYTDRRAVRQTAVTAGNPTWTASEWTIARANVEDMTPGVHPDGPVAFGVTFDKTSGFTIEQGTSDSVFATAANGIAPYTYGWTSSLEGTYFTADSNRFTVLATAPLGDYSAQVVATDSDTPAKSVTNSLNFSVTVPAVKYAITIVTNAPENGTVTTTPATEAAAGVAVSIAATPAGGYAVDTYSVVGADSTPIGTSSSFTMPAQPVTVTVTFRVLSDTATLPIAENHTNTTDLTTFSGWTGVSMTTYSDGDMSFNATADSLTVKFDGTPGELTFDLQGRSSTAGTAPMQFLVEESADGASWTQVASLGDGSVTTSVTPNGPYALAAASRYVRWTLANKYLFNVGLNNISITSGGPPVFSVSVNRTNGFTVAQGASDTITATAANGTPAYGYAWTSTLGASYRTTNGNQFTILATAPTGSYSATVTATDSTLATAQKSVTFSVVGVNPDLPAVVISGSLSGTVGVQMNLSITVTNETANDWTIDLKDPDGLDDYGYGFMPPAFTLTPTKTGTYVLTATADTGSGSYNKVVNLTVGTGGGSNVWAIGSTGDGGSMFFTTSNKNITIVLPTNYMLNAVYGSGASGAGLNNLGQGLGLLNPGVDYTWTPATRTVNILSTATNRRFIRIGATP